LWLRITVPGLAIAGSVFTVVAYADNIRVSRLRQHQLPAPLFPPRRAKAGLDQNRLPESKIIATEETSLTSQTVQAQNDPVLFFLQRGPVSPF
ncbi:MAG: hypothetical protein WB773_05865, partial [Isosphaeraceae bacterium]